MSDPMPDILSYAEYRQYLAHRFQAMKARNIRFSHRTINMRMGLRSAGWFADILSGRQKLGSRHVAPLGQIFQMSAKEQKVLKVLVEMESASTPEERQEAFDKWMALRGVQQEIVTRDKFLFYDRWYLAVLREMLALRRFDGDHAALASSLDPAITPRQAQQALRLLEKLGMLPANGSSRRGLPSLVKEAAPDALQWKRIQKSLTKLSSPALDRFGKDERDFSALTLSLSEEGLKMAGQEIAALRKRLLMLSEKDKGKNRVYQGLFQLFPVSRPLEATDG